MRIVSDRGFYLGEGDRGACWSGAQRPTLILGPTRSGKTSGFVVPNLLIRGDSCVITSTKNDIVRQMSQRTPRGRVLLFDPSGTVEVPDGVKKIGYSPVNFSATWDGSVLVSRSLVETSARANAPLDHWGERAATLLAPLLHVAALNGDSLRTLISTIDARHGEGARDQLLARYGTAHPAYGSLASVLLTDERERSGIWSTAAGLLSGLRTEAAQRSADLAPLDIERFFTGGYQLHVVAPRRHQAVTVPLVVGLIEALVHYAYAHHGDGAALTLILDELANVAPLPNLASIVTEGGGQGVHLLACLQDLSQARARWGVAGEGFVSLFPSVVLLPGIADRPTLELVSRLAGSHLVERASRATTRWGRTRSVQRARHQETRLTPAEISRGRDGGALVLDGRKHVGWVQLRPIYAGEDVPVPHSTFP